MPRTVIGFYTLVSFLKLQNKGDPITPWGWMGVDGMDHNSKYSHQNLSNEGSKFFLSSVELGFYATGTWAFFDEFHILAAWSSAQKQHMYH